MACVSIVSLVWARLRLGLEKRVRNLVDGYRELNDLVEQAPSHVADAASDYARALGGLRGRPAGPPPLKVGSGDQERVSPMRF